jgi:uncharacterized heparinase superfamily protein
VTGTELALLARTAVHLQPGQAAQRTRLRAQRTALRHWPRLGRRLLAGPDPATAVGWPAGFLPLDASCPSGRLKKPGQINLLGVTRNLGNPPDWLQSGAPLLWRFHLHYWDWAWSLAAEPDRAAARALFAQLWRSWRAAVTFGGGDAWYPYPAALRAWSWCGLYSALIAGGDHEQLFVTELAAHAGFLRWHLESDVGGNHLIKDLKALTGLAVFFADEQLLHQALGRLTRQLAVQVLPDGGHFERAPAYHCQVLADLIDIAGLVAATGRRPVRGLDLAIARMRGWLGSVMLPAGLPLLNDGYPVDDAMLAALGPERPAAGPVRMLPDTGLVLASAGGWELLADVGAPCPDELPAHAHADTLGCLVQVDGTPLLVEAGTSTYEPGTARGYERSTAAHNTAEVDGADSTEVWGAFRAARRARVDGVTVDAGPGGVTIEAAHDGYRRLAGRPVHRRRWSLTADGVSVQDQVTGGGAHAIAIRWHLPPGSAVQLGPGLGQLGAGQPARARRHQPAHAQPGPDTGVLDLQVATAAGAFDVAIRAPAGAWVAVETGSVAAGFERVSKAPIITCHTAGALPVQVSTQWRRSSEPPATPAPSVAAVPDESDGHLNV